jgi:hypothetical protein
LKYFFNLFLQLKRSLINTLPPVLVTAQKKSSNNSAVNKDENDLMYVYMNQLRQKRVTEFSLKSSCADTLPYIVMDTGDDENQSRKLFKPIVPNLIGNGGGQQQQQLSSSSQVANENGGSYSQRQALTNRSNANRASTVEMPTPESQMSYKPITPNGPPLPTTLKMLDRSRPISKA